MKMIEPSGLQRWWWFGRVIGPLNDYLFSLPYSTVAGALDGTGQQQFAAGMSLDGLHPGDVGLLAMSLPARAMLLAHV